MVEHFMHRPERCRFSIFSRTSGLDSSSNHPWMYPRVRAREHKFKYYSPVSC